MIFQLFAFWKYMYFELIPIGSNAYKNTDEFNRQIDPYSNCYSDVSMASLAKLKSLRL